MGRNYLYSGKHITIKNLAAAVAEGTLTRAKGFVGIPLTNGAAGASVAFALEGVWKMTYADYAGLGAQTLSVGTILYWDTSAAKLSSGAANDDYPQVKIVDTGTLTTDGAFHGLLLPQGNPKGQDQS